MSDEKFSAWHPGIETEIPQEFRTLETIYDPELVFTTVEEVEELSRETGLKPVELVCFRPHRLAMHDLLLRVNADILITEGEKEEDLGINFRKVTNDIYDNYLKEKLPEIETAYQSMSEELEIRINRELENLLMPEKRQQSEKSSLFSRLFKKKQQPAVMQKSTQEREYELINDLKQKKLESTSDVDYAVYRSLFRVLGCISTKRGFIGNDLTYLTLICRRNAANYLGSFVIGKIVDTLVQKAITEKGYLPILDAEKAVLISLKGASASGKSSLRPTLTRMMQELGIESHGYGTISPDIWRKLLLDYDSLGESYKYAGRFVSNELSIIDNKLDNYRRIKAEKNNTGPNLVVDRFRFDSFASEKVTRLLHKTYIRYLDKVYMYFIVTPPEATVERGWERGIERGRYKAIEDFLAHCVEAYTGMSKLMFKWLANEKPRFFFEFLDNSVAKGEYPRMIAKGTQHHMDLYQPELFVNIERYQHINIMAKTAEEVYPDSGIMAVEHNLGFLRKCIVTIDAIDFIDPDTDKCYLTVHNGVFKIVDDVIFQKQIQDVNLLIIVSELSPELFSDMD